jgi:hypothetical protein
MFVLGISKRRQVNSAAVYCNKTPPPTGKGFLVTPSPQLCVPVYGLFGGRFFISKKINRLALD